MRNTLLGVIIGILGAMLTGGILLLMTGWGERLDRLEAISTPTPLPSSALPVLEPTQEPLDRLEAISTPTPLPSSVLPVLEPTQEPTNPPVDTIDWQEMYESGADREDAIELLKQKLRHNVSGELAYTGVSIESCEHKLGKKTDNVFFMIYCMGGNGENQDVARMFSVWLVANDKGINTHLILAEFVDEYSSSITECMSLEFGEPDCQAHNDLPYLEAFGWVYGQKMMYDDY